MNKGLDVIVVGAGIFGVTAALALRQRGFNVGVVDPGPVPHPLAASTDISKVIRMEYGADETYMIMVEAALAGWQRWNEELGQLYHPVGVSMVAREPMEPGGYEYESYKLLQARGHSPERLNAVEISRRFPAWKPGAYVDGYFHALGGYAQSGAVVSALVQQARARGVAFTVGQPVREITWFQNQAKGVRLADGRALESDEVVVAAGAWTPYLVPDLSSLMLTSGHPVFHLRPDDPELFSPPHFTVFTADIARSGWYGFPYHPTEKVVKVANHGVGQHLHPTDDERRVTAGDEARLRAFLEETFPALASAPIVYTRRCLYNDTLDEHFWIDRHPQRQGLTVAAGGSGHGFKFAPILGELAAAAVTGEANPWLVKFRWRGLSESTRGEEAARHHGE